MSFLDRTQCGTYIQKATLAFINNDINTDTSLNQFRMLLDVTYLPGFIFIFAPKLFNYNNIWIIYVTPQQMNFTSFLEFPVYENQRKNERINV